MAKPKTHDAGTLVYPKHWLQPQDLLIFTELTGFVDDWKSLGLNVDFDLLALQVQIMAHPKQGRVIKGTRGLRKMDFAPPNTPGRKRRGKRKSCRVCYVYFEEFGNVLLVIAYEKSEKDDLTHNEKKLFNKAIDRAYESLCNRYQK